MRLNSAKLYNELKVGCEIATQQYISYETTLQNS